MLTAITKAFNTRSKTPENTQRRKRLKTLLLLPKRSGRSRGRSRPGPPEDGFEKPPVVRRGGAGIGRIAGQRVFGPRPHGVGQSTVLSTFI